MPERRNGASGAIRTCFGSLDEALAADLSAFPGNIEISDGLPLHLYWEDRGSDATLVTFNPAVSAEHKRVPSFSGFMTTRPISANVLMISDPSLRIDNRLTLGWHAGNTQQPRLQTTFQKLIEKIAGDSRIVLYGASGGGFAALDQALRIEGSTALVINPQTDLTKYLKAAVDRYLSIAWHDRYTADDLIEACRSSVVADFASQVSSRVVYLQNAADALHVTHHLDPLLATMHPGNQMMTRIMHLEGRHVPPGKDSMIELFRAVTENSDWKGVQDIVRSLELRR